MKYIRLLYTTRLCIILTRPSRSRRLKIAIATQVPGFNSHVRVGRMCEICCGLGYRIEYNTHAAELKPDAYDGNCHLGAWIQLGRESRADL